MGDSMVKVAWLVVALLAIGTAAVLFRYDLRQDAKPFPVRLDRWTGQIAICYTLGQCETP